MVAPFFVPKIGKDQKKGLRCKTSVSVQKHVTTKKKKKDLRLKIHELLVQMKTKWKKKGIYHKSVEL